ncbi:DUF3679 domain-containing protein [Novibacillus thermophilus]|jgi:hypothetical protein|uniref:DUF3679 domain-containing protein n=1 Tax=Novibacillus thermophilus TaxID=1471761 RepID=A0A1U9K5K9_9BACL|nr:DUF3679 domain-containing protein [Novibacillus thermophilus]AQS55335.1 hypothetical protein B0W44_05605 [Novibacillus thermophilus]
MNEKFNGRKDVMRWMIQLSILCLALLIGVFIGIDRAEHNMQEIQGAEGAGKVFEVSIPEEGTMEISVLGEEYETVQPISEERVEESKNVLAHLGNKAGEALEWGARKILERISEIVDKLTS